LVSQWRLLPQLVQSERQARSRYDDTGGAWFAMKKWQKKDLPVEEIRRYLEPGSVVLVARAGRKNKPR
jgi:hypothetical protein